jgi:predicted cupin superfamily sugar epimerase
MENTVERIIQAYELMPHPEGGFYKRSYCAPEKIGGATFPGGRPFSTAIYYLLVAGDFSALHRIKSDELWHWYEGAPVRIHVITPEGNFSTLELGGLQNGQRQYQVLVPAQCWFAAESVGDPGYTLTGCTVAPGFDFHDFELAIADDLSRQLPGQETFIRKFCRH